MAGRRLPRKIKAIAARIALSMRIARLGPVARTCPCRHGCKDSPARAATSHVLLLHAWSSRPLGAATVRHFRESQWRPDRPIVYPVGYGMMTLQPAPPLPGWAGFRTMQLLTWRSCCFRVEDERRS